MTFTRTRLKYSRLAGPNGVVIRKTGPTGPVYMIEVSPAPLSSTTTTDVVGNPRGNNPFSSYSFWHYDWPRASWNDGTNDHREIMIPLGSHKDAHAYAPIRGRFRDSSDAIVNSSPGRPKVSLPNFVYELREAPLLFRDAIRRARELARSAGGNTTQDVLQYLTNPRKPAQDYLNWQFGWSPMINDIQGMLSIQEWLDHRQRQLKRYHRYGNLRTGGDLGKLECKQSGRWNQGSYELDMVREYTQRKWFSARWQVSDPVTFEQPLVSEREMWRQSLNLNFDLSVVWNSLPWTWLTDWFGNVGNILTLNDNQCGIKYDGHCIMTHTKSSELASVQKSPPHVSTSGRLHRVKEYRLREVFTSLPLLKPNLGLDYLGPGQLTTLGALNVTRNGRVARTF